MPFALYGRFLYSYPWLQEQASKALESALGGNKNEFAKWNKEIKRRDEAGGGGDAGGGGGWFGLGVTVGVVQWWSFLARSATDKSCCAWHYHHGTHFSS